MRGKLPPKIKKFPSTKQRRMDHLLEKNSSGQITPKELAALRQLVAEAQQLMVDNAKRLAEFSSSEASRTSAVPVTVWVQPLSQRAGS